jgi:hypothetical protein
MKNILLLFFVLLSVLTYSQTKQQTVEFIENELKKLEFFKKFDSRHFGTDYFGTEFSIINDFLIIYKRDRYSDDTTYNNDGYYLIDTRYISNVDFRTLNSNGKTKNVFSISLLANTPIFSFNSKVWVNNEPKSTINEIDSLLKYYKRDVPNSYKKYSTALINLDPINDDLSFEYFQNLAVDKKNKIINAFRKLVKINGGVLLEDLF